MKDIIEELGLEGAKSADTPMIQSGKIDSDSRALSLRMPHCSGGSWPSWVAWLWIGQTFTTLHR